MSGLIQGASVSASVFTLVAIAVERFSVPSFYNNAFNVFVWHMLQAFITICFIMDHGLNPYKSKPRTVGLDGGEKTLGWLGPAHGVGFNGQHGQSTSVHK